MASLAACGPAHVSLPPPPAPDAPAAERVAAYQRLRTDDVVDVQAAGKRGLVHDHYEMVLGDGTRVESADDLLVVVPEDSTTARAAHDARAARRHGWGMIALGVVVDAAGLWLAHATDSGPPRTVHAEPIAFGIGGTLVGGALMTFGLFRTFDEDPARHTAFHSYDLDLQRRLRVCADGFRVVACESGPVPGNDSRVGFAGCTSSPFDQAQLAICWANHDYKCIQQTAREAIARLPN